MGIAILCSQNWDSEYRTWRGGGIPASRECPDLRVHFQDPRPSLSQRKTISLRSCLDLPTCKMEVSEEAVSEPAVPLFSPKLLFQEAAGPADELVRSEPGAPGPACACAHGPHLLLPSCAPQWPLQLSAGALPAHTVQSRCAPSRSTGWGWGSLRHGAGPHGRGMLRVIRSPGHRHLLLPRGPSQYCPRLFLLWVPGPGGRSPYTQIPNLAGRPRPERKARVPGSDVRLPKPQQPGRPKLPPNLGPLSKGENPQILLRTGQMEQRRNGRWGVIVRQQRLGLEWDLSQKKWGAQKVHPGDADRAGRP